MKLPALQFYPGDWRKDVGVQSLTYHDRGVWFEILMLMHESEPRGMLLLNGRPVTDEALGRLLGLDNQTLKQTLTTLLSSGVASIDESTGALMNRRMVRDEKVRQIRSEAGKMGGNPALIKQNPTTKVKQKRTTGVKQKRTTGVKQNSTPSSSFSTSIHTLSESELVAVYKAHPVHKDRGDALKAIRKATEKVAKRDRSSPQEALSWLKTRVESYASLERKKGTEARFIKHAARWFNAESYDDEELNTQPPEQRSGAQYRDPAALYAGPEYAAERRPA